jgi:hypothetical protein
MALGDTFMALVAFSVAEGYCLQRTAFPDETFRTVCLGALGVNLLLRAIWGMIIWPFFFNPLRHLPRVPVWIIPNPDCNISNPPSRGS